MALADSVPGVSGGTVAFILGFYDDFVNSLNSLISGTREEKINGFRFISKIGLGWITGFILSVLFITSIFESNIYKISSLFLGFITASIPLIVKPEKSILVANKKNFIFLIIGFLIVFAMTYFNPVNGSEQNLSIKAQNLTIPLMIYLFVSGMIAISAMVLPGISGSTILLIFGLYAPILSGLKQLLTLNMDYLLAISIFAGGIFTGALVTARIARHLLKSYRPQTIYCIIGLVIGSIYAVIMGPTSLEASYPPMDASTFNILFFAIGCTLIPALEKLKELL